MHTAAFSTAVPFLGTHFYPETETYNIPREIFPVFYRQTQTLDIHLTLILARNEQ